MRTARTSAVAPALLAAGLCLLSPRAGRAGPADAAAAPPATQPAAAPGPAAPGAPGDAGVRALVTKLGNDDPAVRDEATKTLTRLGKPALPALREAAGGDDPEVASRAGDLIRHIERHLPPPAPPAAGGRMQSVRTTIARGVRTIDVNDNGQKVHITCREDGSLEMSVTGVEDGREATETYKAGDAGELKRDNPEAFAIYDRWAGNGGGVQTFHWLGGGQAGAGGGPPFPPPGQGAPPEVQELRDRIEQQQRALEEMNRLLREQAEQRVHDRLRGEGPPTKPGEPAEKP